MPEGRVGKGHTRQDPSQNGGGLPIPTKAGDQTKNQVVLHVEPPTKPYQDLCSRCEHHWQIRFGLPTLTILGIWLEPYRARPLPTVTTAEKDRGSNLMHHSELDSILSIGVVVAGMAVW